MEKKTKKKEQIYKCSYQPIWEETYQILGKLRIQCALMGAEECGNVGAEAFSLIGNMQEAMDIM